MADPISITISVASLSVAIGTFAWQHLRKVDAVICTLVANECNDKRGIFQFSFANLGTRPVLLRDVSVEVFMKPELHGELSNDCVVIDGKLPQVIKASEMYSATIETKWTVTFLCKAAKEAESRGKKDAALFFVARVVCWNPKGERMTGWKHFSTYTYNPESRTAGYECHPFDRSFQLRKDQGSILSAKVVHS